MSRILNLGCGLKPRSVDGTWTEVVNLDRLPLPGVNVVWDLDRFPWPFDDEEFDSIEADNVIEHVENLVGFIEECHRLLKLCRPNGDPGLLCVTGPLAGSLNHFIDPTHKRGLTEWTFDFFDPRTGYGADATYYSWARFEVWKFQVLRGSEGTTEDANRPLPATVWQHALCRTGGVDLRFQLVKRPADESIRHLFETAKTQTIRHNLMHGVNLPCP